MLTSEDATYVIARPFYWSVIEINIGVLATSIPSFKALAKRFFPRILGESSAKGRGYDLPSGKSSEPYSASAGGFSKLKSPADIQLSEVGKGGGCDPPPSNGYYNASSTGYQQTTTSRGVSDGNSGKTVDDHSCHNSGLSNSSEEHIMKPGKNEIVRTVEFTTTTEDGNGQSQDRVRAGFYPGRAV